MCMPLKLARRGDLKHCTAFMEAGLAQPLNCGWTVSHRGQGELSAEDEANEKDAGATLRHRTRRSWEDKRRALQI